MFAKLLKEVFFFRLFRLIEVGRAFTGIDSLGPILFSTVDLNFCNSTDNADGSSNTGQDLLGIDLFMGLNGRRFSGREGRGNSLYRLDFEGLSIGGNRNNTSS
mmetsp:Transcript_29613/g.61476  ORF Transcript_29613/g.61476 Transcript_29613/m.61476 type:complete len:103 (-) Transcript_29613:199-507(-)